ncbi:MAG: cation:proton antiporter domain-containing protein [Gammaproteobacteria bacterium]
MHDLAPLIHDLGIILGVAGFVSLLFRKIRQPVVLGYLVAGIIIGPYTPPYAFVKDVPNIKVLAELGVIFLMFSLGLEFSFHKLTRVGVSASITAIFEVLFMILLGYFTGQMFGWTYYESVFLGAALSISSTTIIIKALEELKLKTRRFADVVFGILVVEDLLAILILVALSTVVITNNIMSLRMLWAAGKLVTVVMGWFLIGYFLVPNLFRNIARFANNEILVIVSIALCLLLVIATTHFHYSAALGAFIMGSILAETQQVARIKKLVQPIRNIFAAVFFVSVGMLIDPKIIILYWPTILLISIITVGGKVISSGIGAYLTGQNPTNSLRIGFSMAQIGEFSFIIIALGIALGVLGDKIYAIVVSISVVTTFTTPYFIRLSSYISQQYEDHVSDKTKDLLENYSAWVYRTLASVQNQKAYRLALARFLMNGVIVAILFTLVEHFIYPQLTKVSDSEFVVNLSGCLIAFLVSAPFIWAMIRSFRIHNYEEATLKSLIIQAFSWLILSAELIILSDTYCNSFSVIIYSLMVIILLYLVLGRYLENIYHWFESRLIRNLTFKTLQEQQFQQLAPWDTHLVHLQVSGDSPMIGQTLMQIQFRNQYGINVVAIQRGSKILFAPRGDTELMPEDKLVVLGTDTQVEKIKPIVEKTLEDQDVDVLERAILQSMFISENHDYLGRTIRDSQIREKFAGIVVGLEREGMHILNPDPATTILERGDLLLILTTGNRKR